VERSWDEARFVKVDSQASCRRKVLKHLTESGSSASGDFAKDKSVICILQDETWGILNEGVGQGPASPSLPYQVLKHISHEDEHVRGEGITLAEAVPTANPVTRDAIQENRSETRMEDTFHPVTPALVEATCSKDNEEDVLVDKVKSFAEIDLENNGRSFARVTSAEEVSCIDDVFRDAANRQETRLVSIHKGLDGCLQPSCKHLGDILHNKILERDGPELGRVSGSIDFGEQNKESVVNTSEINGAIKKGREKLKDIRSHSGPES
jgi:hypothetical protein